MCIYEKPIIKVILLQVDDVYTLSQEYDDPWDDSNWNN